MDSKIRRMSLRLLSVVLLMLLDLVEDSFMVIVLV